MAVISISTSCNQARDGAGARRISSEKVRHGPLASVRHSGRVIRMSRDEITTIVSSDPEVLGGVPVFRGTRVPVQSLFDHIEAGDSIDDFLDGFRTVTREQVVALLELCREDALSAAA